VFHRSATLPQRPKPMLNDADACRLRKTKDISRSLGQIDSLLTSWATGNCRSLELPLSAFKPGDCKPSSQNPDQRRMRLSDFGKSNDRRPCNCRTFVPSEAIGELPIPRPFLRRRLTGLKYLCGYIRWIIGVTQKGNPVKYLRQGISVCHDRGAPQSESLKRGQAKTFVERRKGETGRVFVKGSQL
jgi:hypothetical protein